MYAAIAEIRHCRRSSALEFSEFAVDCNGEAGKSNAYGNTGVLNTFATVKRSGIMNTDLALKT